MWKAFKRDFEERFVNWETVNGFLFILWGRGFLWYGIPTKEVLAQYSIFHERFGYNYGLVSLGAVLIVWGLRKVQVNRVKQAVKRERLAIRRKVALPAPPAAV